MGSFALQLSYSTQSLPLIIKPRTVGAPLVDLLATEKDALENHLLTIGGILFRGFYLNGLEGLHDFATGFGEPLLPYDFASTPRSAVSDGIYTSTEYPAGQHIPLHNEQSYTRGWAMRLWLYCVTPSVTGGETPIADSREIYRRIKPRVRDKFIAKGLMYVRNYGNGLDLPWQKVFKTTNKREVETYCEDNGIAWEWKADGELRTRQTCQAIETHPITRDIVWFNQAHLFHVSGLDMKTREALLSVVAREDLPRNVYYGDGSEIELDALEEIRSVLASTAVSFSWEAGDVLMIDNMLTAHGRAPFTGKRQVFVAMAKGHSNVMRGSSR